MEPLSFEEDLIVFCASTFVAVVLILIAWRYRFFRLDPIFSEPCRMRLVYVCTAFFIYLTVQMFFAPIVLSLVLWAMSGQVIYFKDIMSQQSFQGWLQVVSFTLSTAATLLFTKALGKRVWDLVWAGDKQRLKNFLIGMAFWPVAYTFALSFGKLFSLIVQLFTPVIQTDQDAVQHLKSLMGMPWLFFATCFMVVALAPVVEEVLFRGFLQTWLRQRVGVVPAIITSTLTFSIFHFSRSQGLNNIEILASLTALGSILGYLYEKRRSLFASIGLHATFNAITVALIITEASV